MSHQCLGCGAVNNINHCAWCEAQRSEFAAKHHHWPLEVAVSTPALAHVEAALRAYFVVVEIPTPYGVELQDVANIIRAHLQHVVDERRKAAPVAIDPLLA